jgi:hypothetical protein
MNFWEVIKKIELLKLSYIAFWIVVVFTFPVWFSWQPEIPRCPLIGSAHTDGLYCILDFILVAFALLGLGYGIFRDHQKIIAWSVVGILLCICLDLNRCNGMTHFFLSFWILYLLTDRDKDQFSSAILVFIAMLYFWSGINKLNIHFYEDTYRWIMDTIPVTRTLMDLKWFSYLFPLLESIPAGMLFFPRTRKMGILLLITMHLYLITIIAILGRENMIFVWNFFLIMVLVKLWDFTMNFRDLIAFNGNLRPKLYLVIASVIFPLLLAIDMISSEFGYAMFSGRLTYSNMIFTKSDVNKLDKKLLPYLEPYPPYFAMDIDNFSLTAYDAELCRMEFVHKKMFQQLAKPLSDTCMLVITRRPMFGPPQYEYVYKE